MTTLLIFCATALGFAIGFFTGRKCGIKKACDVLSGLAVKHYEERKAIMAEINAELEQAKKEFQEL